MVVPSIVDKGRRQRRQKSLVKWFDVNCHKSFIIEHISKAYQVIDWRGIMMLSCKSNQNTWWIKDAIWMRKQSTIPINQDQGSHQPFHLYWVLPPSLQCSSPLLCQTKIRLGSQINNQRISKILQAYSYQELLASFWNVSIKKIIFS